MQLTKRSWIWEGMGVTCNIEGGRGVYIMWIEYLCILFWESIRTHSCICCIYREVEKVYLGGDGGRVLNISSTFSEILKRNEWQQF